MEFLVVIWEGFWHTLLNVLVAINSVVGSPGVAIIIFTILMRSLTIPLTMKALRSSRNMQQVQPLIKEMQKKYGKDRQKIQEETMKLYRDYGINPAAGCFPMLIQLPIFIGLYSALAFTLQHGSNPAQLKGVLWVTDWATSGAANFGQSFLWVPNLAKRDSMFIWPVLSGVFQFFQSRMSMPRRDPNNPMDPQQRMMQNIMQFMPIYIIFISFDFPAGNVIYWAFSSLFGAVQQYFITGFGSLPDFPGFGFLPRKPIEPPKPLHPDAIALNASKRKGVMARMMEKAVEAQEAQKTAQGGQPNRSGSSRRCYLGRAHDCHAEKQRHERYERLVSYSRTRRDQRQCPPGAGQCAERPGCDLSLCLGYPGGSRRKWRKRVVFQSQRVGWRNRRQSPRAVAAQEKEQAIVISRQPSAISFRWYNTLRLPTSIC